MSSGAAPTCPCGSRQTYAECCGPLHLGTPAVTAEALMRSRFSAFVLGLPDYLLHSWHPSTRPAAVEVDDDVTWRRLQIVDTRGGRETDVEGAVHFRASFRKPTGIGLLEERSRFVRWDGRWVYLDGDVLADRS